jgi:hypothetical protein
MIVTTLKNGLSCTFDACAFCILHSVSRPVSSVCIRIGHVTGPRFANAPVKPGSYVGKICKIIAELSIPAPESGKQEGVGLRC